MADNSRTVPIALTLMALLVGYCLWSGAGVSLVGVPGIQAEKARADSLRDSIAVLQAKIDTARRDIAKESVEDVKNRDTPRRAS